MFVISDHLLNAAAHVQEILSCLAICPGVGAAAGTGGETVRGDIVTLGQGGYCDSRSQSVQ